jgi:hypothetical protein
MDTKQKITAAINVLIQLDPQFADNLLALAKLAQEKPFIYKEAVNKLKSL